MQNKIAVIDIDSVVFTAANPNKVLGNDGEPLRTEDGKRFVYIDKTEAELIESCDWVMNDILKSCEATHYIAYIKGKNTGFRKQFNPEYKSLRPKESPKWWDFVKAYLIDKWKVIEVNNIEVDDMCYLTYLNLPDSFLCCIDKDLLQQEGCHFNWRKKEWIVTSIEKAMELFWKDMIVGQSGDGIKGVPGKGEKFVNQMFIMDDYGNPYHNLVLNVYIDHFGEYKGIQEFYKNYMSLKLLDSFEGFVIPEPIEYKLNDFVEDINGIN